MRHLVILCIILQVVTFHAFAGKKLRVLFIGNSYTYYNNMPQMVADMAAASGDTLVWDMEAPGGAFFIQHALDSQTISKIQSGEWDYVVLQEQSLNPASPDTFLKKTFFHYGRQLDSMINLFNSCSETMFYMTWGRKNGDAYNCSLYTNKYNWTHFCTYNSMDSVIHLNYRRIADSLNAIVSPVGAVWRYIRSNYPSLELYDADESHPSPAGPYTAAACFYTALFKKDPTLLTYNSTLAQADAAILRTAVKNVVYDSMQHWRIGQYRTEAAFDYNMNAGSVNFTNRSLNSSVYEWHFGDGQSKTTVNATHTYNKSGTYNVMLIATGANGCSDTAYAIVPVFATDIPVSAGLSTGVSIYPNPSTGSFTLDMPQLQAEVAIINIYGRVVYRGLADGTVKIGLHQPAGLYMVRITTRQATVDVKLVVY